MKIHELEMCLGISGATIRYYEKERLFLPKRGGNGYRDYSEEDILTLKKIIVFRKLGFSISNIKEILEGEICIKAVAEQNILELQAQIAKLQGALQICQVLKEDKMYFFILWEIILKNGDCQLRYQ